MGKRILVVEDDLDERVSIVRELEKIGCVVDSAVSIRGALRHLNVNSYDVVVSDLNFLLFEEPESHSNRPQELGFELLRNIQQSVVVMPFILHTGDDSNAILAKTKQHGGIYCHKTAHISLDGLMKIVKDLLVSASA